MLIRDLEAWRGWWRRLLWGLVRPRPGEARLPPPTVTATAKILAMTLTPKSSERLGMPGGSAGSCSWMDLLPACVRIPLADADIEKTPDPVHRLIRLIAAYEALVKSIGAISHAVAIDIGYDASPEYLTDFEKGFISKNPSLGNHLALFTQRKKQAWKASPDWFQAIVERLHEPRYGPKFARESRVFKLCRAIERHQQSLERGDEQAYPSAVNVLEHFVAFRNTCFHGSITIRFADKFVHLLEGAIEELARQLRITEAIQFLVPLSFARQDATRVVALDPEETVKRPRKFELGDRGQVRWGALYVGAHGADTLENFIRVSPLMTYDRVVDDFRFLNRFRDDEFEYLSHRSGDLDFASLADNDWAGAFGFRVIEKEPEQPVQAGPDEVSDSVEKYLGVKVESFKVNIGDFLADFSASYESGGSRAAMELAEKLISNWIDQDIESLVDGIESNRQQLDPELMILLAKSLYNLGLGRESITVIKRAADLQPDDPEVFHLLGRSLVMLGKREKSTWKIDHSRQRLSEARRLLEEGTTALEESLRPESKQHEDNRRDVFSFSMLVDAYCRLGDFDQALVACGRGLKLEPQNERLAFQAIYLNERTGN